MITRNKRKLLNAYFDKVAKSIEGKELGPLIKKRRLSQGLERQELAAKTGLTADALYGYEVARRTLTYSTAKRLAEELDTSIDKLIEDKE